LITLNWSNDGMNALKIYHIDTQKHTQSHVQILTHNSTNTHTDTR